MLALEVREELFPGSLREEDSGHNIGYMVCWPGSPMILAQTAMETNKLKVPFGPIHPKDWPLKSAQGTEFPREDRVLGFLGFLLEVFEMLKSKVEG